MFTNKKGKFSDKKKCDIFHITAQNINCGYSLEPPRRGGSNEYPQSMFLSKNNKNNVYSCKPEFYYIKVGFKWGPSYMGVSSWCVGGLGALGSISAFHTQETSFVASKQNKQINKH